MLARSSGLVIHIEYMPICNVSIQISRTNVLCFVMISIEFILYS